MHDEAIAARVLFLLGRAGPCRACELAEFIGLPTCDVQRVLIGLRDGGKAIVRPYGQTERWELADPATVAVSG